ncbi:signal peptidase I [Nocardioides sp. SYSU D00038]|uniref:signal peptidase I n=1 Tax=Nocardioides sp. SYSU D00038 TaxID=2812554 RepID=UPI001F07E44F|nr:signal peptidase I [Nocardioides sp. SYSU D00038]
MVEAERHHRALPQPRSRVLPEWLRWCGSVVMWLVILGCLAVLTAAVLVPRVAGATPYTVLTGSMRPDLPPGTLVVSRPVEPGEIGIGSVITYQLRSGQPQTVTHRVVEVRSDLSGELSWRTRGDANSAPDRGWVRSEQVRGELWYALPWVGRPTHWLTSHQRGVAVYVVGLGLLGYAVLMFARAGHDVRRRRTAVPR